MIDGRPECSTGYFLLQEMCINLGALGKHSSEEIADAMLAHKDPSFFKKYEEAISSPRPNAIKVYKTFIEEDKGSDVYKLGNGGIVEVTVGYVGHVGYRKKVLLFPEGASWKMWIDGKQSYPVDLLKAPTSAPIYVMGVGDVLDLLE
jgi:hypothetical protein